MSKKYYIKSIALSILFAFNSYCLVQAQPSELTNLLSVNNVEKVVVNFMAMPKSSSMPVKLDISFTLKREKFTFKLYKRSVRSRHYKVLIQGDDGSFEELPKGAVNTYQGHIKELDGYIVGVVFTADGFEADIITPDNKRFTMFPSLEKTAGKEIGTSIYQLGIVDEAKISCNGQCTLSHKHDNNTHLFKSTPIVQNGKETVKQARIGFDVAYSALKNRYGGSKQDALDNITNFVNNTMNSIWLRDVLTEHIIGTIIIRASSKYCPYEKAGNLTVTNSTLNQVRSIWNARSDSKDHDLVTLHVGGGGGGLAWVGTVNESYKYSLSDGGNKHAWRGYNRHEMAHTWGLGHGHGRQEMNTKGEQYGIMWAGPHDRATGDESTTMIEERNSSNLRDIGPYRKANIAPYGKRDNIKAKFGESRVIDVLANDHDANRDSIWVTKYDSISANGATIDKNKDGMLVYNPKNEIADDRFYYTVSDGVASNWGVVYISVSENPIYEGKYKLAAKHSEQFISVSGAAKNNGANVVQYPENENYNNEWILTEVSKDYFALKATHSNKYLDIRNASKTIGAYLQTWGTSHDKKDHRLYKFIKKIDDYYNIQVKHSNLCLGVPDSSTAENANIAQIVCSDEPNALFKLVKTDTVPVKDTTNGDSTSHNKQIIVDTINVFPNPAHNKLHVEFVESAFSDEYLITVFNNLGQVVKTKRISNQPVILDITTLPNGMYHMRVSHSEKRLKDIPFLKE